jgi:hypothetical protein
MRRRLLALLLVAAADLAGCAPAGSFRPLVPLQPDRNLEVGTGYVAISPRPVGEDPWQHGGQAWTTVPLSIFDLALIGAFDFEGRATAGLGVRVRAFESEHANVGAGIELGYGWVAFELPMAVGSDRVWLYTAPQLGTWGRDETARLPVGVDLRVHDALHVRTEAQVNYPELDGYQRRVHLGVGLAYEL